MIWVSDSLLRAKGVFGLGSLSVLPGVKLKLRRDLIKLRRGLIKLRRDLIKLRRGLILLHDIRTNPSKLNKTNRTVRNFLHIFRVKNYRLAADSYGSGQRVPP